MNINKKKEISAVEFIDMSPQDTNDLTRILQSELLKSHLAIVDKLLELFDLENKPSFHLSNIRKLERLAKQSMRQKTIAQNIFNNAKGRVSKSKIKTTKLNQRVADINAKIELLRGEYQEKTQDYLNQKKQLQKNYSSFKAMQKDIDALKASIAPLEEKVEQQNELLVAAQKNLATIYSQLNKMERQHSNIVSSKDVQDLRKQRRALRRQEPRKIKLREKLFESDKRIEKLESDVNNMRTALHAIEGNSDTAEQSRRIKKNELKKLRTQLGNEKIKNRAILTKINAIDDAIETFPYAQYEAVLEAHRQRLNQIQSKKHELKVQKKQVDALESKVLATKKQIEDNQRYKTDEETLQSQKEEYDTQLNDAKAEQTKVADKLNALMQKRVKANLSLRKERSRRNTLSESLIDFESKYIKIDTIDKIINRSLKKAHKALSNNIHLSKQTLNKESMQSAIVMQSQRVSNALVQEFFRDFSFSWHQLSEENASPPADIRRIVRVQKGKQSVA